MGLSLRQRIALTWLPILATLFVMGAAGSVLLHQLSRRIENIMRDNYRSVIYMQDLNEALERIDSAFHISLAGREEDARNQYTENWEKYLDNLHNEQQNITVEHEDEYVSDLVALTDSYQQKGNEFFAPTLDREKRIKDYFSEGGLRSIFQKIKQVSGRIRDVNQNNMLKTRDDAQRTARLAFWGFAVALVLTAGVAYMLAMQILRGVVNQIHAMTESATAIGKGNLDQLVPTGAQDELGRLADAFNTMARQLRDYRQSQQARFLRVQRTTQATVDAFPNPVLVVDAAGQVETANPAARRILGAIPDENGEKRGISWQPPRALAQPLEEAIRDQRAYLPDGFDQALTIRADNQDMVFLPRLLPIRDGFGATLGVAVLLEDVTRFRLLDEFKSNLVATVSHELKTPLTSIRLAIHVLSEETVGPLTPKQMELVLDARENAERLLTMINNLLDLARHERGRTGLEMQLALPSSLLRAAVDSVRARAEDSGVDIVLELPPNLPAVSVDSTRMGTVLQNLLDNALSYTERGGQIVVGAQSDDNFVLLTVADTGIGIPPADLPHIFDRFYRIPGRSRSGGTGLGLAIVREIVVAHGGTIECESRVNEGTTFRILLPTARSPKPTDANPVNEVPRLDK